MAELAYDEDSIVSIEGIEMMTKFLTLLSKDKVSQDYEPNIQKMFKKA